MGATGGGEAADRAFAEVTELAEQHFHPDHRLYLAVAAASAAHLFQRGNIGEYLRKCEEIAATRERLHGPGHPETLNAWNNLGAGQLQHGAHAAAEATFRRVLAGQEAAGIKVGDSVVITRQNLTVAIRRQGRARRPRSSRARIARPRRRRCPRIIGCSAW